LRPVPARHPQKRRTQQVTASLQDLAVSVGYVVIIRPLSNGVQNACLSRKYSEVL
jgi:RNase P protein component